MPLCGHPARRAPHHLAARLDLQDHAVFALSDSDRVEALHVDEQITPLEAGKLKGTATGR